MNKHTDGYNNDGFPNFLVCITKKGKNYFDEAYYEIGKKEIDVEEILILEIFIFILLIHYME